MVDLDHIEKKVRSDTVQETAITDPSYFVKGLLPMM